MNTSANKTPIWKKSSNHRNNDGVYWWSTNRGNDLHEYWLDRWFRLGMVKEFCPIYAGNGTRWYHYDDSVRKVSYQSLAESIQAQN